MVNVLLILAFVIEPLLWYQSAKAKFSVKHKKAVQLFILLDLLDSLLGQYTSLQEYTGQAFHTIFFFSYITVFICCSFCGSIRDKLKHMGTMILLYLASDLISMFVLSIFVTVDQISGDGIWNAAGMLLSRLVMFGLIQVVIRRKISISVEMIPLTFILVLMEIPLVVLFKEASSSKGNAVGIVMCSVIQVLAVIMIYYVKRLFGIKNTLLSYVLEESKRIENELESKSARLDIVMEELTELKNQSKVDIERADIEKPCLLEFFENRSKVIINRSNILYIERCGRKIAIVEQDGQKHEINSSITKMINLLGDQFEKINQGIVVNKNCIISVDNECVRLRGDIVLYASRKALKEGDWYEKMIAKLAYEEAKRSANQGCGFFFYQDKLPDKVAKMRKF